MDQQTKRDLKQDHFLTTTGGGLHWTTENRRSVLITTAILLAVIVLAVLAGVIFAHRSSAADTAFGAAMQTYQTRVAVPGQPALPGDKTFPSVKDRAMEANKEFLAVAGQYGSTKAGKNAAYFAGLTEMEAGQTGSAEAQLKKVADGWDKELASLAKLALADLYQQTGRDAQAVDLYNQMTDKPTDAVPAGLAQIELAALYTAQGKTELAHKIYAQLKDKDAKGAAGILAAQKLNPAPAGGAGAPQL